GHPWFFSYTQRPRPSSTLLPYTTLFRSFDGDLVGTEHRRRHGPLRSLEDHLQQRRRGERLQQLQHGHARSDSSYREQRRVQRDEDRKSTRLNSSHQIISYAVFCLKKTKQ